MDSHLRFSVVIPTYNRSSTIARAINSVIDQSYTNWELVVVDDGSSDNTDKVVNQYLEDLRIKYVKQSNQGVCAARNRGAELAKGEFLVFLDSDDWFSDDLLEGYISQVTIKELKLVFAKAMVYNSDNAEVKLLGFFNPNNLKQHALTGTFTIDRLLFLSIGGYNEKISYSENSDLFIRLYKNRCYSNEQIAEAKNGFLCIKQEESNQRSKRYFKNKYSSAKIILHNHADFFLEYPKNQINYKRVLNYAAFNLGRYCEAFLGFFELIKKEPTRLSNYYYLIRALISCYAGKTTHRS